MTKNNYGFSLIEVLIASSIIGGLALGMARLQQGQVNFQQKVETNFEMSMMLQEINQYLLNSDSCVASLGGTGTIIQEGMEIPSIKNRMGTEKFKQGENYGQGKVNIKSILIKDLNLAFDFGRQMGEGKIEFIFKKNRSQVGIKEKRYSFPISLELDSDDKLTRCYSQASNAVDETLDILSAKTCNYGEAMYGINPDGSAKCRKFLIGPSSGCANGDVATITSYGQAICLNPRNYILGRCYVCFSYADYTGKDFVWEKCFKLSGGGHNGWIGTGDDSMDSFKFRTYCN